jgi:guanine nucleotide-binding protein G(I)/G(S)/G(T) subunit beta-1
MNEDTPMMSAMDGKDSGSINPNLSVRRVLRGHFGKVYACAWSQDSEHLVSASQDGKLLIWNTRSGLKRYAISLQSSWVMATDYSPSGKFVASGGLDNMVSIFEVKMEESFAKDANPVELFGHEGYVASCTFLDDEQILSTSGDSDCTLWDIERRVAKMKFTDHHADVMSASLFGGSRDLFVTGSTDTECRLWDIRVGENSVKVFQGHDSDINSVKTLRNGYSFVSGSDDASCRLWDIRTEDYLQVYQDERILCGVTSVDVSYSGRYVFAAYDEGVVRVWDTLSGSLLQDLPHEQSRCSTVRVAPSGQAVISATWDNLLRIWA